MSEPEAWLLGKADGFPDILMPVAHSLLQARKELVALQDDLSTAECRDSLGGAATIGFHVAHIGGSLDRLFTYARGEQLTTGQHDYLRREAELGRALTTPELFTATVLCIDRCLERLTATPEDTLFEPREVGRRRLPSNVLGLLCHAAEHTTMHVGQIRTILKIIRVLQPPPPSGAPA